MPLRTSSAIDEGQGNSVTIGVADEHIGAVVGRGGNNIMEITQVWIVPCGLCPLFSVSRATCQVCVYLN